MTPLRNLSPRRADQGADETLSATADRRKPSRELITYSVAGVIATEGLLRCRTVGLCEADDYGALARRW